MTCGESHIQVWKLALHTWTVVLCVWNLQFQNGPWLHEQGSWHSTWTSKHGAWHTSVGAGTPDMEPVISVTVFCSPRTNSALPGM